jgi:hypothetical protein
LTKNTTILVKNEIKRDPINYQIILDDLLLFQFIQRLQSADVKEFASGLADELGLNPSVYT